MSILAELVRNVLELPGRFLDVAAQGPIPALLVLFGALFVGAALLVFGALAIAAGVELLSPTVGPRRRRGG